MSVGNRGTRLYLVTTRQLSALAGNSNNGPEETEKMEVPMVAVAVGMDLVQQTLHLRDRSSSNSSNNQHNSWPLKKIGSNSRRASSGTQ